MDKQARLRLKYQQFTKALSSLNEFKGKESELNDLEIDGLIHRFELIFELSWKLMQLFLESQSSLNTKGPRAVIEQMAQFELIDPFIWGDILESRNELSHIYDEVLSRHHFNKIKELYFIAFEDLNKKLENLIL